MDVFPGKVRTRIRRTAAMVSLLLAAVFSLGCDGPFHGMGTEKDPSPLPVRMISVDELARRLGLKVTRSSPNLVRMADEVNSVMIFAAPGREAYVNGRRVSSRSTIEIRGQEIFVPERLETRIRQVLRKPTLITTRMKSNPPRPRFIGTVVLDAGHGGKDPGAISSSGYREKHVVLAVTRLLTENLRADGVQVELTRNRDAFVTLDGRVAFANRNHPNLFVSIHADASTNRAARGPTVFVPRRANRKSPSRRAGRCIAAKLLPVAPGGRGVRVHEKNLRVLERTTCPAVLIELGFLSSPQEASLLIRPGYQERLAAAISGGIVAYLEAE